MQIIKKKLIGLLFLSVFLLPKTIFAATDPETFFHQVMGMKEKDFCNLLRSNQFSNANITIQKKADGSLEFRSPRGTFNCGRYEEITLKELREKTNSMPMPGGGTFNVHKGNALDIAVYEADSNNDGAVFQVASNFNGLETTSPDQDISEQLLEGYIYDRTQGPAAAMPAAPGLIWRRYFMFYDPKKPSSEWEQLMDWSSGRKVDFLSAITENTDDPDRPLMSQAGYFRIETPKRIPTTADFEKIRVAYHANLSVMFGAAGDIFSPSPTMIPANQQNTIDQVFAAAAAFPDLNNDIHKKWCRCILQADYEGALRAAFLRGKKRVFLTLMGGGAFGNDLADIFYAINSQLNFIMQSGLEVILVWRYSKSKSPYSPISKDIWPNMLSQFEAHLPTLVSATKGQFIDNIPGAKPLLLPISKNPPPVPTTPSPSLPSLNQPPVPKPKLPERNPGDMVPRSDFFQDVIGSDENLFRWYYDQNNLSGIGIKFIKPEPGANQFAIKTPAGTFSCGHYEQKTIKEIADTVAKKALPGGGTFNVHYGKNLDVAAYQADLNNAGAVFQVASNFNGLETTAYDKNIETETLTDYISDYTQGPFASISAAPGLIYRRFFLFHGQGSDNVSEWGQLNDANSDKAKNRKVNLLENITDIFVSPAGYPCLDNTVTKQEWVGGRMGGYFVEMQKPSFTVGSKEYQCKGINRAPTAKDFDAIQIAYHADIPVLFGQTDGKTHQILDLKNPHTIDQIFAAAIDLAQGTNEKSDKNIAWAKAVLKADYQGALQAAFLKGKKRVFLTLMGGGAFGNDLQHIFDAMYAQKDFIIKSGLEVILIWRPGIMSQDEFQTLAANLEKFANETGGQITIPKDTGSTNAKYNLPPISPDSSPQTPPATPTPETPPTLPPRNPKNTPLDQLQTSLTALKTKLSELAQKLNTLSQPEASNIASLLKKPINMGKNKNPNYSTVIDNANRIHMNTNITDFTPRKTATSGSKLLFTVFVGEFIDQQFNDGSKAALVCATEENPGVNRGGIDLLIDRKCGGDTYTQSTISKYKQDNNLVCPKGQARITPSFQVGKIIPNITAQHIIYTVGPDTRPTGVVEPIHAKQLRNAYENSMYVAWVNGIDYVTFPSISTGLLGYNVNLAAPNALDSIIDFLSEHKPAIKEIRFFHWKGNPTDYGIYKNILDGYVQGGIMRKLSNKSEAPEIFKKLEATSTNLAIYPPLVYEYTVP